MNLKLINIPTLSGLSTGPLPGYSIESNYASRLIQFKSQVIANNIQTAKLLTALSCIDVTAGRLNKLPQENYKLPFGHPDMDSIQYEFDNISGKLWKSTATSSNLIIDLNFEADQNFSRADFAIISVSGTNISTIIFAVTHSKSNPTAAPNKLYILFDDLHSGHNGSKPIAVNDLVELNNNREITGNESGFFITLAAGKLDLSAITTINDQIVFITQSRQANSNPQLHIYKNLLYQINLTLAGKQLVQTRTLADSSQLFQLKTQLANQNTIVVGTELTPLLVSFPLRCRQVYQYEE